MPLPRYFRSSVEDVVFIDGLVVRREREVLQLEDVRIRLDAVKRRLVLPEGILAEESANCTSVRGCDCGLESFGVRPDPFRIQQGPRAPQMEVDDGIIPVRVK